VNEQPPVDHNGAVRPATSVLSPAAIQALFPSFGTPAQPEPTSANGDSQNGDVEYLPGLGPEHALADPAALRAALEAILLVIDEPVTETLLAQTLDRPQAVITGALEALATEYTDAGRGFDLRRAAGGWRLYTRTEQAIHVERFVLEGQSARLTQAGLETLAVIAYKQPVTRSRVSAIRGVSVDGVMRTLMSRGLIAEHGTDPDTGGHLFRTTPLFLEKLGLNSLDDLPALAPLLPGMDALDDVISSAL
jgi:segregation and condensation protein B